jgi:tetratricopeptide (TPR) repeat protein
MVAAPSEVEQGARIGRRYEIVRLLGRGGMGAVYLARDHALGRDVALKVVAAHLADDEGVALRFKREIQLSSLVTHPNVLRVFDLGEADGLKFLTMQFIEGETLADLMKRERPLPIPRCLTVFHQICEGLAAAHAQKVMHRDLKPQNVLIDREGRVYLTDFGLARSSQLSTVTRAGALMGTPQYMSPEQVKGDPVDERSDIFSLGVMLHELLAGKPPFSGDTLFELMMSRTRAPARPAREANPEVPLYLQRILDRCLAVDPALRYQSVPELLADLDAKKARGPGVGRSAAALAGRARRVAAVAIAVIALAAVATWAGWRLWPRPQGPPATRTLLVADVENRTGDQILTGTLEPVLGGALEAASFLAPYNRASAQKTADRLNIEGTGLPEKRARLVAQREGIAVVVSGFVENERPGYRLGLRAVDAFTGERIFEESASAGGKDAVLVETTRLAARLRRKLGDATSEGDQLKEADSISATSLEAAHEYAIGAQLAFGDGKYEEARPRFLEAIRLDPKFAHAYASLAALEANLNRYAEADKWYRLAMANTDRLTEREKLRTRGGYYIFIHDGERAIEAYAALVRRWPADNVALAQLALAYSMAGEFGKALEYGRKALDIYPRKVVSRSNVGYFAMYAGDLQTAIVEQQRSIEYSPTYAAAYIGLALAELASERTEDARATWEKLRTDAAGGSAATEGLADLALFEGRRADAQKLLARGAEADLAGKDPDAAARKLATLASVLLGRRDVPGAVATAERALKLSSSAPVLTTAGLVLADAGKAPAALAIAAELDKELGAAPSAYAALLRAAVATQRGSLPEAIVLLQGATKRLDHWLVRYALGRAHLEAGSYTAAVDELEKCDRRRGEATDVFVDSIPTYRLYPPVKYWLGRAQEALGSAGAAESYQAFLAMRKTEEDPLVADARRRVRR